MPDELSDADRFLLFFSCWDPNGPRPETIEGIVKVFAKITGWDQSRALSAFEVNVVKGFIDKP